MRIFKLHKNYLFGIALKIAISLSITSCSDDEFNLDDIPPATATGVAVSGDIVSDVTWTANNIYILKSRIVVKSGVTLTIEAGTIIKGEEGAEANAKPLIIAQGAKIMAQGTAANPIIFTSTLDNIQIGQKTGSNLTKNDRGLWAGLIILGKAPISPATGTTARIEGIPASVVEGVYGGNDPVDNSGVLQYVSVRHAGVELVPGGGNEINGITLGGVGSGTTIDHVEVIANLDDGIEWFGGTVNVTDALVAYQGDDGFDIDQAYSGTISNIAYFAGTDSDHALEIDGPEGSLQGSFVIDGGELKGDKGEYVDFRSNAKGLVQNLYFYDFEASADVELDNDGVSANYANGNLTMSGCVFNAPTGVTLAAIANDKATSPPMGFDFDAEFAADANQLGATVSSFDETQFLGWSWADNNGLFGNGASLGNVDVTTDITSDVTWTANNIYYLRNRIIVKNGATLTIEAGTIIKGDPGAEANAKPLVIAQGARINAVGTATDPIIFTSSIDNIAVGQKAGANLDETNRGLWAGIIILGKAPISPATGTTARIEGIPASVAEGVYGGNDPMDNSGVLQYVSVRHAGVELVPGGGNEINGITLGGVGSGTTIDHVEVIANLDDGIEWFGGTVNVSDALVAYQGDDAFDIDQAYSGTISNIAYLAGTDSDHALEIDGPEGAFQASFTINGGKLKGNKGEFADFRSNAKGTVQNLYFWNFENSADVELDNNGVSANYANGDLTMQNCVFNVAMGVTLTNISNDKATSPPMGFDFNVEFAADSNMIGNSVPNGFDKSQFTGWTWADNKNRLSDF